MNDTEMVAFFKKMRELGDDMVINKELMFNAFTNARVAGSDAELADERRDFGTADRLRLTAITKSLLAITAYCVLQEGVIAEEDKRGDDETR